MAESINKDAATPENGEMTAKKLGQESIDAVEFMTMLQGKIYDILTSGGDYGLPSEDNFFCWATPGIPVSRGDYDFVSEGLSGVVRAKVHNDNDENYDTDKEGAKSLVDKLIQKRQNAYANAEFKPSTNDVKDGGAAPAAAAETTSAGAAAGGTAAAAVAAASGESQEAEGLSDTDLAALRAERSTLLYLQAESFARMVDFIPDVAGWKAERGSGLTVLQNDGTLSDAYRYALRMSQVMSNELDEKTKAKIEKFRNLLTVQKEKTNLVTDEVEIVTEPSPMSKAYHQMESDYVDAVLAYNSHRIAALGGNDPVAVHDWAINAQAYNKHVKAALAKWESEGYKSDYEAIQAYIHQVTQRDMKLLKQQYEEDVEHATLTGLASGSNFLYTTLSPANFATSKGWQKVTFSKADYSDENKRKVENHSLHVDSSFGVKGIGSLTYNHDSEHNEDKLNTNFHFDSMTLKFEICQVNIVRPWFNTAFLTSKYWRFDPFNTKNEYLSDGEDIPTGKMPAYPTSIIFIRNLEISFDDQKAKDEFLHKFDSKSNSFGAKADYWIFSGSLNVDKKDSTMKDEDSHEMHQTTSGIMVPGMQIIGYRCHLLPKSPDPNPEITEWA